MTTKESSFSAYVKSTFERDIMPTTENDVEHILKEIQTIDHGKIRRTHAIPGVIDRLLNPDDKASKTRVKNASHNKENKRRKEIREVRKVVNPLDNGPSSAHYTPNFESILSNSPKHKFSKSEKEQSAKTANLENCTMGEMLSLWSKQIRRVNFQRPKDAPNQQPNHNNENDRPTVRPAPDAPPPPRPQSKASGLISYEANRDSFINQEQTPGPSDYQKITYETQSRKASAFSLQASRPNSAPYDAHIIRDVGHNIDSIKPRTPQCISFNKQSARCPTKARNEDIWSEIEAEQEKIILSLKKPDKKKKKKKRTKQPFSAQTKQPPHPFGHLMRKETEPSEPYNVERNLKSLEIPVKSFDISTPAESHDRMIYRTSEAPDKMYDNVNEQFKNTVPRPLTPVPLARTVTRHPPYYYMPKPCGQGLYNPPVTSMNSKRSVDIDKMAERQFMLDSPGSVRKKVVQGIPPPLDKTGL